MIASLISVKKKVLDRRIEGSTETELPVLNGCTSNDKRQAFNISEYLSNSIAGNRILYPRVPVLRFAVVCNRRKFF